mmetsp:Transcript_138347/g.442116  ORF Transcript_138347/g.442116 Transcript_138347/m.442116 type:complete len:470 (+) Transcript_138347:82-1491(+)
MKLRSVLWCGAALMCFVVKVDGDGSLCEDGGPAKCATRQEDQASFEAVGEGEEEAALSMLQMRGAKLRVQGNTAEVPHEVPHMVGENVMFKDVADEKYIFMLSEEKVGDGRTLHDATFSWPWPREPSFNNDALWAFGSPTAPSLYVWSVGTHAMCLQYADTLIELAASGFWVLCPAISHDFSIAEWVLKSVVAVDWALAKGKFSKIMLGGHSGGGPVALSSGYILSQRKVAEVSGFVLQHPGAVSFVNVPGCASHTNNAENKAYCDQFFPANMLGSLKGPILITCGTFCQVTKAENSNFFNSFSCSKADSSGACQSQSGAVTCKEGYCANEPWLENPSDCMTDTACEDVFDTFVRTKPPIAPPLGGGTLYTHCGEHEFSVMGPYGWKQEGLPAVRPFLKAAATGDKKEMTTMQGIDGQEQTCWMQKRPGDSSLKLESMDQAKMRYMSLSDHSPWVSATDKVEVVIAVIA